MDALMKMTRNFKSALNQNAKRSGAASFGLLLKTLILGIPMRWPETAKQNSSMGTMESASTTFMSTQAAHDLIRLVTIPDSQHGLMQYKMTKKGWMRDLQGHVSSDLHSTTIS